MYTCIHIELEYYVYVGNLTHLFRDGTLYNSFKPGGNCVIKKKKKVKYPISEIKVAQLFFSPQISASQKLKKNPPKFK